MKNEKHVYTEAEIEALAAQSLRESSIRGTYKRHGLDDSALAIFKQKLADEGYASIHEATGGVHSATSVPEESMSDAALAKKRLGRVVRNRS